jgi:CheY-like chemotaxis protein
MSTETILVVDDSIQGRYATARVLRAAGYDVREAGSGRQALAFLTQPPALMVLDLALQDSDGFEICRQYRQHPKGRSVPILMKTAVFRDAEHEQRARSLGADAYFIDPIDPDVLVATVARLLGSAGDPPR